MTNLHGSVVPKLNTYRSRRRENDRISKVRGGGQAEMGRGKKLLVFIAPIKVDWGS